jgi:formate hydrogenlyase transcriptional activator
MTNILSDDKKQEDLYYRLNVFPITVPPLRSRPEDIPLMGWAFVREFAQAQGKAIEQIAKRTMDALQRYALPGNVREPRNIIERATILSSGPALHVELPAPLDPTVSTIRGAIRSIGLLPYLSRRHQ